MGDLATRRVLRLEPRTQESSEGYKGTSYRGWYRRNRGRIGAHGRHGGPFRYPSRVIRGLSTRSDRHDTGATGEAVSGAREGISFSFSYTDPTQETSQYPGARQGHAGKQHLPAGKHL